MLAAGLMAPAGLAKVEAAKAEGSWNSLDAVEALEIPPVRPKTTCEPISGGKKMQPDQPSLSPLHTRVRASFEQQTVMAAIGASLRSVTAGAVKIELPYCADLCQQEGFLHAGIITTVVDSACGYAAFTLMPDGARVLSVEFKINFLAPAVGDRVIARGMVARAGRTVTVCTGEVVAVSQDSERVIALMQATMMAVFT